MKTLNEITSEFDLYPHPLTYRIKYFKNKNIDWNVYLPTKGKNLQRDFVWTIDQKRELIFSVLIHRHIPPCAIMNIVNKENINEDTYLIIDGKQRLSTIFDFIDNKFTIVLEDNEYLFSELPEDYQKQILNYDFNCFNIDEPWDNPITDEQKITWFKFINFAGTPQDKEYLNSL